MCCTRLAENTWRKNDAKNHHLRTIVQICQAISSQLRHISTFGKEVVNLLNSNIFSTYPHNTVTVTATCVVRRSNNSFGDRCFAAAGPRLWKTLPIQLRHCDSLRQFKRLLKTYLFGGWDRGALWHLLGAPCINYLTYLLLTYCEFRRINGWYRLVSLGHPSKCQKSSRLGFVTAPTSLDEYQSNFSRYSAVSWAGTLYVHFWGTLPSNGILLGAIFTLRPSLAFFYIGSVTARHWSSWRQPNLAAWYKEWDYGTFAFQQRAPPIFRGRPSRWA